MNRFWTILLFCCCLWGGYAQNQPKIAIFDPMAVSILLESGKKEALRELISSTIVNSKRYNVLERAFIERILQEQAFSHSSMVNDNDAVAIGKLAGAEKVLLSVLTPSSDRILFTVKLLNLETSNVECQQVCYARNMADLFEKIASTILELCDMGIGVYEGEQKNGKPHGYGVMKYRNGGVYRGAWENGERHGWGQMEGAKMVISNSAETYSRSDFYEGDWMHNVEHGRGVRHYYNGNEYNGEWKHGKESGRGVLSYKNGNRFEGEFLNGKPVRGELILPNGNRYEGSFDESKGTFPRERGDVGVMNYVNGNRFEGKFYPNGITVGVMFYRDGGRYEGRLVNGKRVHQSDGYDIDGGARYYYFGIDGATMYYSNGDIYKGYWKDDKRNGKGVMKWNDGKVYDGYWKNDMMHGEGTMTSPKGFRRKGYWYYGTKQKKKKH